jgi:hypothetical protein
MIKTSISSDLRFHLQEIDDPDEAWEKNESMFGKQNIIQAHQLENHILTLIPNDFSCIEDYLSKFKTLNILCEECNIKLEEERCIYIILSKLGSAYSMFLSTFYAMREDLGKTYQKPTHGSICDALIIEQYKLIQLGLIDTTCTSNKTLVSQQKDKPKNPKKKHPHHNNKQNKGPKPTQTTSTPNGDKGEKSKNKKSGRHCNFCGKDGHYESNFFKKMSSLEEAMKKQIINIYSTSSSSSSHGHALSFWFLLQCNFYFFF